MKKVSPSEKYKNKAKHIQSSLSQQKICKNIPSLKPSRSLTLSSEMVFVKVDPLRIGPSQEKVPIKEKQVVYNLVSSQELLTEKVSSKPSISPKKMLSNEKKKKQSFITLNNFEGHLREIWLKNTAVDFEQFFKMSKKISNFIDPTCHQYVNINKRWCLNFFKKLKEKRFKYQNSRSILKEPEPKQVSDTFYEMFSQPQSAQMEININNSSQIWRKHTFKMLQQKYPADKVRSQSQNENAEIEVVVINQKMKKTLYNRREELLRLQNDFLGLGIVQTKQTSQPKYQIEKEKGEQSQISNMLDPKIKKTPRKKVIYTFEELKKEEIAASRLSQKEIKNSAMKKVESMKQSEVKQQYNSRGSK